MRYLVDYVLNGCRKFLVKDTLSQEFKSLDGVALLQSELAGTSFEVGQDAFILDVRNASQTYHYAIMPLEIFTSFFPSLSLPGKHACKWVKDVLNISCWGEKRGYVAIELVGDKMFKPGGRFTLADVGRVIVTDEVSYDELKGADMPILNLCLATHATNGHLSIKR